MVQVWGELIGCNFIIYFIINFPYYLTRCGLIAGFYSLLVFGIYFREQNENTIISANLTVIRKEFKQQASRVFLEYQNTSPFWIICGRQNKRRKGTEGTGLLLLPLEGRLPHRREEAILWSFQLLTFLLHFQWGLLVVFFLLSWMLGANGELNESLQLFHFDFSISHPGVVFFSHAWTIRNN